MAMRQSEGGSKVGDVTWGSCGCDGTGRYVVRAGVRKEEPFVPQGITAPEYMEGPVNGYFILSSLTGENNPDHDDRPLRYL
jgi:hypothetical protein